MSLTSAVIGGVGGAIIGFLTGGAAAALQGLEYGTFVGALFDKGKTANTTGPRISDLTTQTSNYGAAIPRLYAMSTICGNVFWIENNKIKEVCKKNKTGGKGGGGSITYNTYSYYGTFALGLCRGPIVGVRRIWINKKLFYSAASSDLDTVSQSGKNKKYFTVHTGTETQNPDSRMQATLGVANTTAYRGLAYIVFKDLPLKKYGNSIASTTIKVEVCQTPTVAMSYKLAERSNPWAVPSYGYNNGYNNRYIQNPYDSDGRQNMLICVSYTDYAVQQIRGQTYSWYHYGPWTGTSSTYGFQDRNNMKDASFVFLDTAVSPPRMGYYSKGELTIFQAPYISGVLYWNAQMAEADGVVWFRHAQYLWKDERAPIISSVVQSFGAAMYVRNGNPFFVRIPALSSASGTLFYTEIDSSGALVRSGTINFTQTQPGARFLGLDSGTSNGRGGMVEGDYFYFSYLSDYNTGTGDCTVIGLVFNLATNQLIKEVAIPYTMGADTPTPSVTSSAAIVSTVHDGVVYCQWTRNNNYGRVYFLAYAPLQFNGTTTPMSTIVSAEVLQSDFLSSSDIDVTGLSSQNVRGYVVSSVSAIQAALTPLQGAYPFDIIQAGYKIKFKPRGHTIVATIPKDDLAAVTITS